MDFRALLTSNRIAKRMLRIDNFLTLGHPLTGGAMLISVH